LANLIVRTKIMPKEAEISPKAILESLRNQPLEIKATREEPIAFGLVALVADFQIPDEAGEMDKLENLLRTQELIGEFEIVGVSRLSTSLKK
jgi:elongation factor 1-beta